MVKMENTPENVALVIAENNKVLDFIKNFQSKNEYNPISLDAYNDKWNIEFKQFFKDNNFHIETAELFGMVDNATTEDKIKDFINDVNKVSQQWIDKLNTITNALEYKEGSRFSFNIDRLERFVKELNEFKKD